MSEILSKYVAPGGEVELKAIDRERNPEENGQRKAHRSRLLKILTESRVEVAMPIVDGKLILLPLNGEYDMYFYGDNVVYQCNARVTDRYRFNGQYVLVMDLTSNLRNYQRREYYRFSCALEMNSLILCKYHLQFEGREKEYRLVGKVLAVNELEKEPGVFDHRVQYVNVDPQDREEIIQYIFDEARKAHRKTGG